MACSLRDNSGNHHVGIAMVPSLGESLFPHFKEHDFLIPAGSKPRSFRLEP